MCTTFLKATLSSSSSSSQRCEQAGLIRDIIVEKMKENGRDPTYSVYADDHGNPTFGCKHYERGCKIEAPCCDGAFVTCRLCHDELFEGSLAEHTLDRFKIEHVLCMHCGEESPVAEKCSNPSCGRKFSEYFCGICRMYEGSNREVYHCEKCGICRLGRAEDNVHCDDCGACVVKHSAKNHRCNNTSMLGNCPVCMVSVFNSTTPVAYLRCGHTMHHDCLETLTRTDYRCAVCLKSLCDMSAHWGELDRRIASEGPLPPELAQRTVNILCNDCNCRSTVPWHFQHHKCQGVLNGTACGSYNTRIVWSSRNIVAQRAMPRFVSKLPSSKCRILARAKSM